jgi:energy-coupling factor transporter ATP-binding protein EcfA2
MSQQRLADRLSAARQRRFVGRAAERALFQSAITAAELPFQILHIYGPGGVGKTTLLHEFATICQQASRPVMYIDGRYLDPAPGPFTQALLTALGVASPGGGIEAFAAALPARQVVLIDTYETLAPLETWLSEVALPQLPGDSLIVLAGRQPPSLVWRADPGWQTLISTMPLRNLRPEESKAYLNKREVPADQHQTILDFTHGHPLALSLVADVFAQRRDLQFQPEAVPDIVKTLLEQLVQKVPGPAHRAALEACALVRLMTEALLAEMLSMPDVHELFEWLRGLSFIESGREGLFPHDLTREALGADLRWRNPDWYAELHRRARNYYTARLQQTHSQEQVLYDYIFLHRDNAVIRPFFEWQESTLHTDASREGDWPALAGMVAKHEGEASAQLAMYWFRRQPEGLIVFRDAERRPAAFMLLLALDKASAGDIQSDPATLAAWRYLQSHAPLRQGETATHFRFWMGQESYQAVSAIQSLIFVSAVRHYLTTPGLAFHFFPCAEPEFWAPVFAYADLARIPEADYEIGGHRYGAYGHDWRVTPPTAWLALLAERETALTPQAVAPPQSPPSLLVLSQPEFEAAVQNALRQFAQPDLLRNNPLLRSRMVIERAGVSANAAERVTALQSLLKESAETLQHAPRETKYYRALYHTYFQPAPTQERAAELLDLPFSTYRRHLRAGITRLVSLLWQRELEG